MLNKARWDYYIKRAGNYSPHQEGPEARCSQILLSAIASHLLHPPPRTSPTKTGSNNSSAFESGNE